MEKIQNNFITYNLKIKGNTPYPILIKENISPIERTTMTTYLLYENKLNMEGKNLPLLQTPTKTTFDSRRDDIQMLILG
jgi:hypothetical protein